MMTRSSRNTLAALAILIAWASAATHAAVLQDKPADVAGAWSLTVDTGQGTGTPGVTFKQDGETLTGTYASQVFGEQPVKGTVKGNAITFGFTALIEGNQIPVTFTGTVEKDTMKGEIAFGDFGGGTFTGRKKGAE